MDQYFSSDVIWTESVFDVHYTSGNVNDTKIRKCILFRQGQSKLMEIRLNQHKCWYIQMGSGNYYFYKIKRMKYLSNHVFNRNSSNKSFKNAGCSYYIF